MGNGPKLRYRNPKFLDSIRKTISNIFPEPKPEEDNPRKAFSQRILSDLTTGWWDNLVAPESQVTNTAITWFPSKSIRVQSGQKLMENLRSRFSESDPLLMSRLEKAYERYPRLMAHLGGVNTGGDARIRAGAYYTGYTKYPTRKYSPDAEHIDDEMLKPFIRSKLNEEGKEIWKITDEGLEQINSPYRGEPIYKPSIGDSFGETRPNSNFNNRIIISLTDDKSEVDKTLRHELTHLAQDVRDPWKGIQKGKTNIPSVESSPINQGWNEYRFEPVEISARNSEGAYNTWRGAGSGVPLKEYRQHPSTVINDQLDYISKRYDIVPTKSEVPLTIGSLNKVMKDVLPWFKKRGVDMEVYNSKSGTAMTPEMLDNFRKFVDQGIPESLVRELVRGMRVRSIKR